MAYNRTNRNNRNNGNASKRAGWEQIIEGVSVAGTAERFSLSFHGAVIHGCRIINGKNGPFIGWPSFRGNDGKYRPNAYVFAPQGSVESEELEEVVSYFDN